MKRVGLIVLALAASLSCRTEAQEAESRSNPGAQNACAEVLLKADLPEPYLAQAKRREALGDERMYRWIHDALIQRVFSFGERAMNEDTNVGVMISRRYSNYWAEVTGLECASATEFLRDEILQWHSIEVGVVGEPPVLSNADFQSTIRVGSDSVSLVLREQSVDRLRKLTAENIGRDLYVEIDDERVLIAIRMPFESGRLVVERSRLPEGLAEQVLLPFRVEVIECRACELGTTGQLLP